MKTYIYKSFLVLLCICMLVTATSCKKEATVGGVDKEWTIDDLAGTAYSAKGTDAETQMDIVASNDGYDLLMDRNTATIAVRNKATGYLWKTNADDNDQLSLSESEAAYKEYRSQLLLTYYDGSRKPVNYNSFEHAVDQHREDDPTLRFYSLNNGVRVVYTIGQSDDAFYVPKHIYKEDFDKILSKITPEQQQAFINAMEEQGSFGMNFADYYEEQDYDSLISYAPDAVATIKGSCKNFKPGDVIYQLSAAEGLVQREIYRYFLKDMKDDDGSLMFDNEYMKKIYDAVGVKYEEPNHPKFTIAVDYTLSAKGMRVSVETEKIIYDRSNFKLNTLQVLPFFGTVFDGTKADIFLPDGSGALVDVAAPSSDKALALPFYGNDYSFEATEYATGMQQASLPVYGITRGNDAFVAYVADGEAIGSVKCQPLTTTYPYSYVGPYFTVHPFEEQRSNGASSATTMLQFATDPYMGNIAIDYMLLGDTAKQLNYVDLAKSVRNYLFSGKTKVTDDTVRFYLETYGAVLRKENFLGYAYNDTAALTTFEQAATIYNELNAAAITNIAVRYNNVFTDGFVNKLSKIGKVNSALGGAKGLKTFTAHVKGKGGMVYANAELVMEKYSVSLADATWHAKYMGGTMVNYTDMTLYSEGVTNEFERLVVKSNVILEKLPGIGKKLQKLQLEGVSLSTIGDQLFTDFTKDKVRYRDEVKDDMVAIMKAMKETYHQKLLLDGGNAYALSYADDLMNVALSSSSHYLSKQEVPFMQIVLHGYVPYAGISMNLSDNYDLQLLKSVEYGANLAYTLNYASAEMVKNTNYSELYSTNYAHWKEKAIADYQKVAAVLNGCQNATIEDHVQLAENVFKTTYSNGAAVIVNYAAAPYVDAATGTQVEAASFARVGANS